MGFIAGISIGYVIHTAPPQSTTNPTQSSTTQATTQPTAIPTVAVSPMPTPKPTPTPPPKWTTVQTFQGNGIKKTGIFTVPDDWKIAWSCTPSSFYGGSYNVQVFVYGSDNSLVDLAVNVICKAGTTSDVTEEHQAGDVYLSINSEGAWTIQVQELK